MSCLNVAKPTNKNQKFKRRETLNKSIQVKRRETIKFESRETLKFESPQILKFENRGTLARVTPMTIG